MADHPRKLIRDAVVDQLRTYVEAGTTVIKSKRTPWTSRQLPGIAVYTLSEERDEDRSLGVDGRASQVGVVGRTLTVTIVAALAVTDDIDDALDAKAQEIEDAIDSRPTFGISSVLDTVYGGTTIAIDPQADQPVGEVTLTYSVTYFTE